MRLISRYIKYIFYRAFVWQCKIQPTEQWAAHAALSAVILIFLLCLSDVASAAGFFYPNILEFVFGKYSLKFLIAYFIIVGAIPYLLFVRDGRYKKIITQFEYLHETPMQKWIRGSVIIVSILFLLIAFILLAVVRGYYGNLR